MPPRGRRGHGPAKPPRGQGQLAGRPAARQQQIAPAALEPCRPEAGGGPNIPAAHAERPAGAPALAQAPPREQLRPPRQRPGSPRLPGADRGSGLHVCAGSPRHPEPRASVGSILLSPARSVRRLTPLRLPVRLRPHQKQEQRPAAVRLPRWARHPHGPPRPGPRPQVAPSQRSQAGAEQQQDGGSIVPLGCPAGRVAAGGGRQGWLSAGERRQQQRPERRPE
mmetsp:Transcript_19314/g.74061  ORF Transcript_19314/g.74061 Transcript_19314/m.74061 type:complete len:223 (+) Transcript_19314:1134-1802(+)